MDSNGIRAAVTSPPGPTEASRPTHSDSRVSGYARAQRRASGDAVVRFGTPVSMRSRLDAVAGDDLAGQRLALNKLAFEVAVGINRATPVLAPSLVTLALLGVRDRALTLAEVQQILVPLLDYVDARQLPESGTALLRHPGRVAAVLDDLIRADVVTSFAGGDEPVYSITPGQHLVAAFYRNNSIHWFVNRGSGQQMLLQGRVHSAEALSGELFASALKLAAGRDLLEPAGPGVHHVRSRELSSARTAFAGELRDVAARIQLAADIDAEAGSA